MIAYLVLNNAGITDYRSAAVNPCWHPVNFGAHALRAFCGTRIAGGALTEVSAGPRLRSRLRLRCTLELRHLRGGSQVGSEVDETTSSSEHGVEEEDQEQPSSQGIYTRKKGASSLYQIGARYIGSDGPFHPPSPV